MDGRSNPLDLLLEVISPVVRQRRDSRDAPQPIQIVLIADIEPRHLRDRHRVRGPLDQNQRVSRPDLAFGDHPEIETGMAAGEKSLDDIVATKFQAKLEAWHSRLGDDDLSGADAKPVANLHVVLPQAFGREILAEHAPTPYPETRDANTRSIPPG